MKRQFLQFLTRWGLNSVGLFTATLFLSGVSFQGDWVVLFSAAFVLSVINAFVKPFVVILSLPALLFTLGIFSIVINGLMVYLAHLLYSPFQVNTFGSAILAGLVVGLVNYILTQVFDVLAPKDKT